jgi:hypothetical protein
MRIVETLALWQEIQPQDIGHASRRHQLLDIIDWCTQNTEDQGEKLCESVRTSVNTDMERESSRASWSASRDGTRHGEQETALLNLQPWDLAQYLAIYDYLYIVRMVEDAPLDELLCSTAKDVSTTSLNPDLRTEQVNINVLYTIDHSYNTG